MGDEWDEPDQRGGFGGNQAWPADQGNGYSSEGSRGNIIEVESGQIGRLIGKKGAKIRELQDISGAKIDVPKDRGSGPMVQVELSGSDSSIHRAREMINELLQSADNYRDQGQQSYGRGGGRSGYGGGGGGYRQGGFGDEECSTCIEVSSNDVGRIIGKGGLKVRELQDHSGARINVPKDRGVVAKVELTGSQESVSLAKQMIEEILQEDPGRRNTRPGQSYGGGDWGGQRSGGFGFGGGQQQKSWGSGGGGGFDGGSLVDSITVSSDMVGRVIGKGGSKVRELKDMSGCTINVPSDRSTGADVSIKLSGDARAISEAKRLIKELISEDYQYSRGGGGGGGGFGRVFGDTQYSHSITMDVETSLIGKVIGRGGCKIKEMQEQSQARIKVPHDRGSGPVVPVTISGEEESVQIAKQLIEELIEAPSFSGGYGSRGGYDQNGASDMGRSHGSEENRNRNEQCFNGNWDEYDDEQSQSMAPPVETPPRRPVIDWGKLKEDSMKASQEKWAALPPIKKNFYIEDPEVANLHADDVAQIRRENNNIIVMNLHEEGEGVIPNPVVTFEQAFQHYPDILDELYKAGFSEPSPIQKQGWPVALSGTDLIGIAQTGTGKTLAFLLPAFIHIENQPVPRNERVGPTVLVLSPTRELALQIESEVKKYSYRGIKCCCVYGGGSRKNQIDVVKHGVEIIVATPGRLNDLIASEIIRLDSVTYLVLDEADRMLDMGFEPEIRKVLLDIRPDRHTLMTSATWPEGVRRLARSYMTNPIQVYVGTLDLAAVHSVTQRVEIIDDEDKRERLTYFLTQELDKDDKVIVFVGRKVTADDISSDLSLSGVIVQCIHGDREQSDREQAIKDLKDGSARILIATDVASRGLDISDVTHVFNYDFPRNIEEYVHRVGRTGRAGKSGTSLTLITRQDWRNAKELIRIMEEANQEVPEELSDMAERYEAHRAKMRDRDDRGFGRRGGYGNASNFTKIGGDRRGRGGRRGGGFNDSGSLFMSCI